MRSFAANDLMHMVCTESAKFGYHFWANAANLHKLLTFTQATLMDDRM